MAFVAFEDCVRMEVRFRTSDLKSMEVTLWLRKTTGAVTQDNVDILADLIDAEVDSGWLPLINTSITYVETYVRDMTAEISYQATNNDNTGLGGRIGTGVEDHSALLIQRKSGLVGRKANGRIYLPGAVNTDKDSNSSWDSAYMGVWENELEDTMDAVSGAGTWLPIVASRTLREAGETTLLSTFPVAAWVASANIAAYRARSTP